MNLKYTNIWYTSQVESDINEYIVVDVTSRVIRDKKMMNEHPNIHKDFSPFYVGPIITSDGLSANIFEHFWQASKVFPCHVDRNGNLSKEYFEWRKYWFNQPKVIDKTISRRPHTILGYKDNDCLFSVYYNGSDYERLSYIEARKKIYVTEYAKKIVNTDSYKWLESLVKDGKKVALVDFDGFNYYYIKAKEKLYNGYINKCKKNGFIPSASLMDFTSINDMKTAINCSFTPVGHSFVIKALLQGDIEVKDGKVIDNIGMLDVSHQCSSDGYERLV